MFLFKSCPRCHGDLHLNQERDLRCLQCGREVPREAADALIAARLSPRTPVAAPAAKAA